MSEPDSLLKRLGRTESEPALCSILQTWGKGLERSVGGIHALGLALAAASYLALPAGALAARQQVLKGHVPAAARNQPPMDRLASSRRLDLALGLPLRNQDQLKNLLRELYRPGSSGYRHYLTSQEFTAAFGPTEQDYKAVMDFARAHRLKVTGRHPNRTLLDVNGAVEDIEQAFHVRLGVYQHPIQPRRFYAPDAEPTVELDAPLLGISGLDNYTVPRPRAYKMLKFWPHRGNPLAGSGTGGTYLGNDFRAAYVPGVALTGTGQSVGLFELDGYSASDISLYETQAGLPGVTLTNVLIDGFGGGATEKDGDYEVCLDIEMTIAMAPGLSRILVYEGPPGSTTANVNDILNRMATDNQASQLSCSWQFDINISTEQIFQQYAAQGQSFFLASGDSGAYLGAIEQPADDPSLTVVGGTTLTTSGPGGSWVSETTWNWWTEGVEARASSGGISITYPIPIWQEGISMSANQGSTAMRNLPDVAMVADNVWGVANGAGVTYAGTSIASPLWAALTALVNERAAALGQPAVGFLNPALYSIGKGPGYTACFHDITTGNNAISRSSSGFPAVAGYDLCTGWGTPIGSNLIQALLAPPSESLVITPPLGFTANGPIGGPFQAASQTYSLTNAGPAPLNWSLVNTSLWLTVSPASGTLNPGGPAARVTATLNSVASNLLIITHNANLWISNLSDGVAQNRQFNLLVGNGGFETGDFTDWTLSADADSNNYAMSTDDSSGPGGDAIAGVDDSQFVHAGLYGAFLGQFGKLAYLSQTLPTVAGQEYLLSFLLTSIAGAGSTARNQFTAGWNGVTLCNQSNAGAFAWTNLQFVLQATSASTARLRQSVA